LPTRNRCGKKHKAIHGDGQSFVLTGDVTVGQGLKLMGGDMTVDLGVYTLTVTAPDGKDGDDSSSDGVAGFPGDPGGSGLTVDVEAVLTITGSGTLAVTGGNGG